MLFRLFVIAMMVVFYFQIRNLDQKIDQLSMYNDQLGISLEKFMNQ